MRVSIKNWGSSKGLRLPKQILEDLKWNGEDLELNVKNGKLIAQKVFLKNGIYDPENPDHLMIGNVASKPFFVDISEPESCHLLISGRDDLVEQLKQQIRHKDIGHEIKTIKLGTKEAITELGKVANSIHESLDIMDAGKSNYVGQKRLFLFIDRKDQRTPTSDELTPLIYIASYGRRYGIHLVISQKNNDNSILSERLYANIPFRVSYDVLTRTTIAYYPKGVLMLRDEKKSENKPKKLLQRLSGGLTENLKPKWETDVVNNWPSALIKSGIARTAIQEAFKGNESMSPLSAIFGVDSSSEPIIKDLATVSSLMLGGTPGSGKTVGLHQIILTIMKHTTPEQVKFILNDSSHREFESYKGNPFLTCDPIETIDKTLKVLQELVTTQEKRLERFKEYSVDNMIDYNQIPFLNSIPFVIFVADDLLEIINAPECGDEARELIHDLIANSSKSGIRFIFNSMIDERVVFDKDIITESHAIICYRSGNAVQSNFLLGSSGAESLKGFGDSLVKWSDNSDIERVQALYFSNEDVKRINEHIKATLE